MSHRSRGFRRFSLAAGLLLLTTAACADPTTVSDSAGPAASSQPMTQPATQPQAAPDVVQAVPAALKQKGTLVLATNAPYPPLEYFKEDNKTLIGYDIDLGKRFSDLPQPPDRSTQPRKALGGLLNPNRLAERLPRLHPLARRQRNPTRRKELPHLHNPDGTRCNEDPEPGDVRT